MYRYYKVVGTAGDVALGEPVVFADAGSTNVPRGTQVTKIAASAVTASAAGGTAVCRGAGVCVTVGGVDTGNYAWFQTKGYNSGLVTDGGVVKGDPLVVDGAGSPVGVADTAVSGDIWAKIGVALSDDTSGNTVTCELCIE